MSLQTFFTLVRWAIIGLVAGYLASLLLRTERQGCLVNVVLGVVGAYIGGFVFGTLLGGFEITGWAFLDTTIHATVGAVILLIVMELVLPGQQLGKRRD